MLNPIPKLLALGAFTTMVFAGTWLLLDEGATNTVDCGPCGVSDAPVKPTDPDVIRIEAKSDSPGTIEIGPETEGGSASPSETGTSQGEDQVVVDYREGDTVNHTAKDEKGNIRVTGTYKIILLHKERDAKEIETRNQLEAIEQLRVELTERVNVRELKQIEKFVEEESLSRRIEFKAETDYDASRVPDGWVAFKVKHGTWTHYYADNTRQRETLWQDGARDGAQYKWNEDGTMITSGYYTRGKMDGRWSHWNQEGVLASEFYYEQGMLHGTYTAYHANGRLKVDGQYERGMQSGLWIYYDENGALVSSQEFNPEDVKKLRELAEIPSIDPALEVDSSAEASKPAKVRLRYSR